MQDVLDLLDQKAVDKQLIQETQQSSSYRGAHTKTQYCSVCGKPSHNARTCQEAI